MPSISFRTIKGISNINGTSYPMYSGFLSANILTIIATVPSFSEKKQHFEIARDISSPPVDEWQRPLDQKKLDKIKIIYSNPNENNLMANPVLLGIAKLNIDHEVYIDIAQTSVTDTNGNVMPINDIFEITIHYKDDKKPLWILDGQHRVEGMKSSSQKNEPIPFVLLHHDKLYTPPFLAEIFTQVTTTATPMERLHAAWMKYAFDLEEFEQKIYKDAMETTTYLCKDVAFDQQNNPFQNKIHFNPYLTKPKYYAFDFDMIEWMHVIASNYYGSGGKLSPKELAGEIVKAVLSFEKLDNQKNNKSKIFSNDNPHKILAEGFLSGLLKYIAANNKIMTINQWEQFFLNLSFDKCDWSLHFYKTTGALSSGYGNPSKNIAKECFETLFLNPSIIGQTKLTDYLQGVGAQFRITAYQLTSAGRLSKHNTYSSKIMAAPGLNPFNVNSGNVTRNTIKIESETPNCHILDVLDTSYNPPKSLRDALKAQGLDITTYSNGKEIHVISMNYSGDTEKITVIRLDK